MLSTVVLSILGVLLMIMGAHGPQILAIIGAFLLLPAVILTRLGVPVGGIPFVSSNNIVSILVFLALQAAYYYGLLQLIYFITRRNRHRSLAD